MSCPSSLTTSCKGSVFCHQLEEGASSVNGGGLLREKEEGLAVMSRPASLTTSISGMYLALHLREEQASLTADDYFRK